MASSMLLCSGLIFDSGARAFIPPADRTMQAVAETNRASGRAQALQLELTMSVGGRAPVARGELVTHPTGLARLELRGVHGRIERYLLSGRELMATRDGILLEEPRALLQPIFLMQPSSETTLRAALETFGVLVDEIGLAPCGEEDCFVIGDPRLSAPLPGLPRAGIGGDPLEDAVSDPLAETRSDVGGPAAKQAELEGPSMALPIGSEGSRGDDSSSADPQRSLLPRIWLDTRNLEVRRIDRAGGVFMIVGPTVAFGKLKVPAWFEIHEPGAEPVRFEVDRAVAVNAPPKAFSRSWLMTPVETTSTPAASPAAGEAGAVPSPPRAGTPPRP
jgi:hypothetical protein